MLEEEGHVEQFKGIEDPDYPDYVYGLNKAFYGLKQAPHLVWETYCLLKQRFKRGREGSEWVGRDSIGPYLL